MISLRRVPVVCRTHRPALLPVLLRRTTRLPQLLRPRRASEIDFVVQETTRAVLLFVFFTSALNYLHYRELNERDDENDD